MEKVFKTHNGQTMQKLINLLVSLSISVPAQAKCRPVTFLTAKEPAPCDGYLFTPEKELEIRIKNEERKLLLEQLDLYARQNSLYKQELDASEIIIIREREKSDLWARSAEQCMQQKLKFEERSSFRDWLFLIGGVLLTVASGYAINSANK